MIFQVPVTLHQVRTTADKGLSITLLTPELNADEIALLFALKDKSIWCAMKELPVKQDDLKVPEVVLEGKYQSPSQHLRACLYRKWEKTSQTKVFEEWYIIQMNKIVEMVKEQI